MEQIKILLVDDDNLLRRIVGDRLALKGYKVTQAKDGEEGLAFAASEKPDIVITDWIMPKMDGVEFCKKLRENPEFSKLPIIMLTSRTQTQDKITGLDIGADDYLTKPFDPQELEARVKALLRRTQQ